MLGRPGVKTQHRVTPPVVQVHVVGVQGEKIQLSMRSKEESEAHSALMADGAQSAAPEGAGTLGHALAAAGISAKLFKAVGDS